jgi:hypothetical protein
MHSMTDPPVNVTGGVDTHADPRNLLSGADVVQASGRPYRQRRYREVLGNPAWSKNLCMCGAFMRENREIPCSPVAKSSAGRLGNTKVVSPG